MKKTVSCVLAIAATLTLSACHPPNEQPSDKKVDTAKQIAAPTEKVTSSAEANADLAQVGDPGYVDCGNHTETLPSAIHLRCTDDSEMLTDITWSKTGSKVASGTGVLVDKDTKTPDVPVTLSEPMDTGDGYVFTAVTVNGKSVTVQ